MIIREAVENDYKYISSLSKNELGYSNNEDLLKEKLKESINSNHEKIYVAEDNNEVIGFIHAEDYRCIFTETMKNILGFAVVQGRQHCGTGAKLLDAVEKWAIETGVAGIRLNSSCDRVHAHKFYRAKGFNKEKQQIRFVKIFNSEG